MDSGPKSWSTTSGEDIDLYCLECGYNLRGLSGDPRRCPECGHMNPVGLITIPAAEIARQLREMETSPATCVGTIVLGGPCFFAGSFVLLLNVDRVLRMRSPDVCVSTITLALVLLPPLLILRGVTRFRRSCLARGGWAWALLKYHAYAFLCVGVVLAPFGVLMFEATKGVGSRSSAFRIIALLATAVIYAFFARKLIWWAYRKAKEDMEPLQREVAVTVARDRLRKALSKRR